MDNPEWATDCPLCISPGPAPFCRREGRAYLRCSRCGLTFMHPSFRLDAHTERARYAEHNNTPGDPRYRAFLGRLADPLLERLAPGARGLDYGSGPGPTLSLMFEESGFPMRIWDPFFAPDPSALEEVYGFVTCSETVEHFHQPAKEFHRLDQVLEPGGYLGIMTGIVQPDINFETWWYVRDPTHVVFYAPETFTWIADHLGWTLEPVADTVVLFRKGRPQFRESSVGSEPTPSAAG